MQEEARRSANQQLVIQVLVPAAVAFVLYGVFEGALFTGVERVVAFVVAVVIGVALVALARWRVQRTWGGRRQLRAFDQAVRRSGVLPPDADLEVWRRFLMVREISLQPWRLRLQWLTFVIALGAAQSISRGDGILSILIVSGVVGVPIGLVAGQVIVRMTREQVDNVHRLHRQVEEQSIGGAA